MRFVIGGVPHALNQTLNSFFAFLQPAMLASKYNDAECTPSRLLSLSQDVKPCLLYSKYSLLGDYTVSPYLERPIYFTTSVSFLNGFKRSRIFK